MYNISKNFGRFQMIELMLKFYQNIGTNPIQNWWSKSVIKITIDKHTDVNIHLKMRV